MQYFALFCAVIVFLLMAYWLWQSRNKITQLQRSVKGWEEDAARHCRNEEYYRGLVQRCGKVFGAAAYECDDGKSVSQDILCAKVPELVEWMAQNLSITIGERQQYMDSYHSAAAQQQMTEQSLERAEHERDEVSLRFGHLMRLINAWDKHRTDFRVLQAEIETIRTETPWERPFSILQQLVSLYCIHSLDMVQTGEQFRKMRDFTLVETEHMVETYRTVLSDIDRHFGCNHVETGTSHVLVSHVEEVLHIVSWTQAAVTALAIGSIEHDSQIHHKLRGLMIEYRGHKEEEKDSNERSTRELDRLRAEVVLLRNDPDQDKYLTALNAYRTAMGITTPVTHDDVNRAKNL